MRPVRSFALLFVVPLTLVGCGGPGANTKASASKKVRLPAVTNHLGGVFDVIESPPADAGAAWVKLGSGQPKVGEVFYPGWDAARQGAAFAAAWGAWSAKWGEVRQGIYTLENVLDGAVNRAAKAFHKAIGQAVGGAPRTTVHLYFVPDLRASTAVMIGRRGHIGLNAGALALLGDGAIEREVLRQLAVLTALGRGDVPKPETVAGRAYLEGLGAWGIRAVKPQTLEGEVVGASRALLAAAQAKVRELGDRMGAALDSTDGGVADELLAHGGGDPAVPVAGRLAAYGVVRAVARNAPPAQVMGLGYATFRERAGVFWSVSGADRPAGGRAAASGGGAGGALQEERSAAEMAAMERGGKTAECVGAFPAEGAQRNVGGGGASGGAGGAGGGATTLGLIADIKRADDDTLRNLKSFVEQYRKAGISALLVAGDVSETSAGARESLDILATVGVPVLVIPGNRESTSRYRSAMSELGERHANLVDMARVRLVNGDGWSVVSLPGYYDPKYVHARDGCLYRDEHVAALPAIAAKATAKPVILLAHSPPKAAGTGAIDYADAGANVGDPAMTAMLQSSGAFDVGIYANLHETGGRAARADLKSKVRPGSWVGDIHLVVGSANSMPWSMLDGGSSEGMAGLLDIDAAKKVRYRILKP